MYTALRQRSQLNCVNECVCVCERYQNGMYVCMYVGMYAHTWVGKYVCMYAHTWVGKSLSMYVCMPMRVYTFVAYLYLHACLPA